MLKKIICMVLCITVCIGICACSNNKNYNLFDYTNATVLTDENYTAIKEHVLNTVKINSSSSLPFLSSYDWVNSKGEVVHIMDIGIKGVPVLLDLMKSEFEDNGDYWNSKYSNGEVLLDAYGYAGILEAGLSAILHCEKPICRDYDDSHETFRNAFGHGISGLKANNACFFLTAQSEIPKILSSSQDTESKFPELARFGIIAIPYVLEEINNGKAEFEAYFTYIGLHLSDLNFIETARYVNSTRWGELQKDNNFTKGAEDFNYKEWLNENQADLKALFKYIEEYTEEYKKIYQPQDTTDKNVLDEIMTNEEQTQIRTLINDTNPEYKLYLSGVVYSDYKEESDRLASVDIKGVPVILAAPFVMEEIEKGKTEYREFFIQAGLHLSTDEFMELTADGAAPLKERYSNAEYMKDAESFDCNAWWNQNKNEIENLNKFIKEY